jgi:hypothetical protein
MSFPKKGKFFPKKDGYDDNGQHEPDKVFAVEIAAALRRSLGDSSAGAKVVASWTGANEKTVKNWFAGKYATRAGSRSLPDTPARLEMPHYVLRRT